MASREWRRIASFLAVTLVGFGSSTAEAQVIVSGRVSGEGLSSPLSGALIEAVDDSGEVLRALAGPTGRYALNLPSSGSWRFAASYLGFETSLGEFQIDASGRTDLDFLLAPGPYLLDGLTVTTDSRCPVPESPSELIELLGRLMALQPQPEPVAEMEWEIHTQEVLHQAVDDDGTWGVGDYLEESWDTVSVEAAGAHGAFGLFAEPSGDFIVPSFPGGESVYAYDFLVPTLRRILSEGFMARYCLRVERDAELDRLGLRFSIPESDPRENDIEGVIWVTEELGAPFALEFSYSSFPPDPDGGELRWAHATAESMREQRRTGEVVPLPEGPVRPKPPFVSRVEYASVRGVGWIAHRLDLREPLVQQGEQAVNDFCCATRDVWNANLMRVRTYTLLSWGAPGG